jgi:hypothetical protein
LPIYSTFFLTVDRIATSLRHWRKLTNRSTQEKKNTTRTCNFTKGTLEKIENMIKSIVLLCLQIDDEPLNLACRTTTGDTPLGGGRADVPTKQGSSSGKAACLLP